jgi:hypothetical protein
MAGPTDGVFGPRPVPLSEAGGSVDYVTELRQLCERYRLDRVPARTGSPLGSAAVTWMTDDGPVTEQRDSVRELLLYLRARFAR